MDHVDLTPMTVVETPLFIRKVPGLLSEEERGELIAFIGTHPESGEIVPESGGVRKLRWAVRGRGKLGGVRVIYYFHSQDFPIFLLTVYSKTQKANLTGAERNEMRALVPVLVRSYTGRGQR